MCNNAHPFRRADIPLHCHPDDKSYKIKKQTFKNKKHYEHKVIERKDPRNPEHRAKYGFIVNLSKIGIEEIATRISGTCTKSRGTTVWPYCRPCKEQIIYALQEGKRVHLGDIGSFRTVANGLGSDTAEKYDPAYITKLRVCFTPTPSSKSHVARQQRLSRSNGWTSCLKREDSGKKAISNSGRKWKS